MTVHTLFKYGRLNEYTQAVISTPTVWFSPPKQLNDPFECRPWITFNGSRYEIIESGARGLRQKFPELTLENATAHAVSMFLEGRHRDPNATAALRQNFVTTLKQKIGLYCLSEHNDSILMWSHYAADHAGYCLEFEATDYTPFFGAAQQVNYANEFPVVDIYTTPREELVDRFFLTKFQVWAYEGEWRIVNYETGPGIREYPRELLRSVIFGMRMPQADREIIRSWVKERGHPVRFFETQQHDQEFKIVVKEIN